MKTYFDIKMDGLILKTTVPIHSVQYFEIDVQENEHGRGIVRAQIMQEYSREILHTCFGGDEITVLGSKAQKLFSGLIEKVDFIICNDFVKANIYFVDNTYLMDIAKKRRSFQDPRQNYAQIISKVLSEYEHADYMWQTETDRETGQPILQFEETDWEFIRRLATHFHTVIYPEYRSSHIMLYMGNRHGSNRGLVQYKECIFFRCGICDSFYTKGGYKAGKSKGEAAYIEIVNRKEWDIGDTLQYDHQNYMVYRKKILFSKGEVVYHYVLGQPYYIFREKAINDELAGIGIKGKVDRVQEQNIFIQLEIDQEKNAQYPWKWMPETSNLCYCMPEEGTDVMLYFTSGQESSGLAIHSFHENQESGIYSNIPDREIHTLHDKKLAIYPTKLFMEGKEKNIGIYAEDKQGIQLKSTKGIRLNAEEGIYINGKRADIFAPFEIVLRTDKSNIEINRDFNFYAPEGVQTNGTADGINEQPAMLPQEKETDHWQMAYSAMAAVPTVDFAKADDDGVVDLMVSAAIPKIASGKTTFAMSDVMNGKPESEARFASALRSMDLYTVKGGYSLPKEKL